PFIFHYSPFIIHHSLFILPSLANFPPSLHNPPMNQTAIVTGATSGIGRTTALELAKQGLTVILAVRNEQKAKKTTAEIRHQAGHDRVNYLLVDFSSQAQIRRMAAQFLSQYGRLNILINNAGTINILRRETEDGLEETFAVNHLGYFLLTNLLLDRLIESGTADSHARIINVSSSSHWDGRLDFDNLQLQRGYSWRKAYGNAKLANILFTIELADRLKAADAPVTANALHPGWVATGIGADAIPLVGRLGKALINLTAMSPEKGAQTTLYLATSPEVENVSGLYFKACKPARTSVRAQDKDVAKRLWEVSEELVGLVPVNSKEKD
ncbi:MAG: SDR family oxidoreductase, partial [Candidatus Promineifilaceae bacterium]